VRLIFWLAAAMGAYVYIGYPVLLALLAWRGKRTHRSDTYRPTVSLVIAAYNEDRVLREKLENSLAIAYPPEKLQIIVASDGSTDCTNAIAREYADRGVVLKEIWPRGGKTRAINLTVPETTGEILVLSDANTMYRPDAVWRLVRHFADPSVGAVSGDVQLVDSDGCYAASEGLYYRYERWLQHLESRVGSIVGADGAMYALRRCAYRDVPTEVVVDDFVISMNVARAGSRVIYDPEAVATEKGTTSSEQEYRRKRRIVAGGLQALASGQGVPSLRQPLLLWCYVSHKLLRWLMPLPLIAALVSSVVLSGESAFFAVALAGQATFYMLAALRWIRGDVGGMKLASVAYYFCLVNGAALAGIWRALWRSQGVTWRPATR
jgi:cellulose synthase/poly-beta-1,6-N-acetylglucosamine synthase-like glycosyltransferase